VTHPTFENDRTFGRTYPFGTKGVVYGLHDVKKHMSKPKMYHSKCQIFEGKKSGDGTKCNKKRTLLSLSLSLSLFLSLLKIQNNLQNSKMANDCQLWLLGHAMNL
jgi:hypothetical protein